MKYINFFCLFITFTICQGQNTLLVDQTLISDWSGYPVYQSLIEGGSDGNVWKEEFRYLDSIDVYWITYLSDGLKIRGLLAKPKKAGKYPSIIYNRGGNREFGALVAAHGALTLGQIANHGYVVIASQYRGNGGGEGQEEFGGEEVNDVLILPAVLAEIDGADADRIGMYGWSRGGMMTYRALIQTNKIKAAVVGGALADCNANITDRPDMETYVYAQLIPNYTTNKEEELNKRSAITWADKFPKDVPILLLHGNSDWRVKPEQSLRLALEFEKHRIPYRLIMFEGADHGISEHKQEVHEQMISWFDRYLKNNEPLPDMEYHGK